MNRFHVINADGLYIPSAKPSDGTKYFSSKTPSTFGYNSIELQKILLFSLGADVLSTGNVTLL